MIAKVALTETAYAKINLALHVRKRREDGYHELETVFAFVDAGDRLSVDNLLKLPLLPDALGELQTMRDALGAATATASAPPPNTRAGRRQTLAWVGAAVVVAAFAAFAAWSLA